MVQHCASDFKHSLIPFSQKTGSGHDTQYSSKSKIPFLKKEWVPEANRWPGTSGAGQNGYPTRPQTSLFFRQYHDQSYEKVLQEQGAALEELEGFVATLKGTMPDPKTVRQPPIEEAPDSKDGAYLELLKMEFEDVDERIFAEAAAAAAAQGLVFHPGPPKKTSARWKRPTSPTATTSRC